ncbi:MAG: disulfide bond formation protein DsbA [Massilia sp.]|jgi:protein-disulfide isomerase|nr:disulfide bond formation protein DsbA [Massilia sp.]MDB5950975.1 disulfide bond formation protein DsbA [Massilia sp.]
MNSNESADDSTNPPGLAASDHVTGNPAARVTLVEYGDYECPRCAQAQAAVHLLLDAYGDRLRFVYRHYPDVDAHPHSELAAEAAEAAAAQGKFWEMHALLFNDALHLGEETIVRDAATIGLDTARLRAELAGHVHLQRVREQHAAAARLRLRGTPGFFLDDVPVDVSYSLQNLEQSVRAALGEA